MNNCQCGGKVFISTAPARVRIVIDSNGNMCITEVYRKYFFYVRCENCGAVYLYKDGIITVPRETLIRTICKNCNHGGVACTECDMMEYRSQYKVPRIEDVSLWPMS